MFHTPFLPLDTLPAIMAFALIPIQHNEIAKLAKFTVKNNAAIEALKEIVIGNTEDVIAIVATEKDGMSLKRTKKPLKEALKLRTTDIFSI